ncbi:pseudouridine synthase [Henriciella aquimarina]|uniref:pseudouridine synthase n=1 Tax=Henriciella aquimarina TaxID=545261 RepID=UPI000A01E599|nr:pseudouridine synthase [Henriciella aquimarina]
MTDRRETPRPGRRTKPAQKDQAGPKDWDDGERIAKWLARAGVASRRACESLIEDGQVAVNGRKLTSPAFKVTGRETITVKGKRIRPPEATRLWRYHKPSGLITTTVDPAGRRTIFEEMPKHLPRVVTVGRLDLTTEGLLLLTNDGELARSLELPSNEFQRTYRARAHGKVTPEKLEALREGITVEGTVYAPIVAELERETGTNNWIKVTLTEGKKREVRRALEAVGLEVNRLIRVAYGPFTLGDLAPGAVEEVLPSELRAELGNLLKTSQSAPDDAPWKGARKRKPRQTDAKRGLHKMGRSRTIPKK